MEVLCAGGNDVLDIGSRIGGLEARSPRLNCYKPESREGLVRDDKGWAGEGVRANQGGHAGEPALHLEGDRQAYVISIPSFVFVCGGGQDPVG